MPLTKSNPKQPPSWQFNAIGTRWVVETSHGLDPATKERIMGRIDSFDKTYSRFRDDSLVARVAEKPGTYEFPQDVTGLVDLYRRLYDATDGAVTPLVGDTLAALGYDKHYSLEPKGRISIPKWDMATIWHGRQLTTHDPVTIDFGAVGKGYLVDEVASILEDEGINEYVVDGSGDIRHRGDRAQIIGLENPFDVSMVIGTASVKNMSLCASATNRRRWGNGLHHVIDGRTGEPTDTIVATWVIAKSTALADGIATALFFAPAARLHSIGEFHYVRMFADGHIEHPSDFVGELFI